MLTYDTSQFPQVILRFTSDDWGKDLYNQTFSELRQMLDMATEHQVKIKLFVYADAGNDNPPPVKFWLWIVRDLISFREQFHLALDRTVIYKPSSGMKKFFNILFKLYTPTKPCQIHDNLEEAVRWLHESFETKKK